MSSNLTYNCEFTQPIISKDSFIYSSDFTTDQQNNFYCSCGIYAAIQNGSTAFGFPDPLLINETQFFSIQYASYIQQSFTVTIPGSYRLSLYYTVRSSIFLIIYKYI